jgi:hypothetical protein
VKKTTWYESSKYEHGRQRTSALQNRWHLRSLRSGSYTTLAVRLALKGAEELECQTKLMFPRDESEIEFGPMWPIPAVRLSVLVTESSRAETVALLLGEDLCGKQDQADRCA